MLDLLRKCFDGINQKYYSTMIFLDSIKAFDSVSHQILMKNLRFYGIHGLANDLLQSYLNDRMQFVSINNTNSSLENLNKKFVKVRFWVPSFF